MDNLGGKVLEVRKTVMHATWWNGVLLLQKILSFISLRPYCRLSFYVNTDKIIYLFIKALQPQVLKVRRTPGPTAC